MKKKNILNLIRCHVENNDVGFRSEAREIARELDAIGDTQLSAYIMSLLSTANVFVPQEKDEVLCNSPFLDKVVRPADMLLLPDAIVKDVLGIVNAVNDVFNDPKKEESYLEYEKTVYAKIRENEKKNGAEKRAV